MFYRTKLRFPYFTIVLMLKKFFFLLLLFYCKASVVFAQNHATNLKPLAPPYIDQNTPDWALEMYSAKPNVHKVHELYRAYYATHPFEKTVDTRNYKHWNRYLSKYDVVQDDGTIILPTDEETEAATNAWLKQKAEFDAQDQVENRSPTSVWTQIGPFENTGTGTTFTNVQSCQVALSQCIGNLNVLYTVSQNGKIFKTIDHGETWNAVGENYFFAGDTWTEQCLAVHPTNPDIVYYGSGTKIWKTIDGGNIWTTLLTVSGLEPNCIIINPNNTDIVLISSEKGIYKSINGSVFDQVRAGVSWDLRFKTNDPTTVFALCQNGLKTDFYKSIDTGGSWNPFLTGWFNDVQIEDGGGRMTVSTGNSNLIYCFVLGRVTGDVAAKPIIGIAKSTDAGANWTKPITYNATQTINGGQGYYDLDIEVSDADDNLLLLGTQSTWKTTDGFATVTYGPSGQHSDPQEYHFNGPNDFWVASDGGIDLYNNLLTSRLPKSKGVTGTEFWGFDQGWNEDTRVGSYYHNGTSGYRPLYPNNQFLGTGGAEPSTGYVSIGNPGKVWFSEVGGKYLPALITGTTSNFSYNKFPNESANSQYERGELVPHPLYFNTHFLGTENILWKTTDGGTSFTAQYTFGADPLSRLTSIEISRANPLIMFVFQLIKSASSGYSSGKLWKSIDGGVSFNELAQPANAPTAVGCFIALNPANADHIWLAYNKTTSAYKVFKTTNGGGIWTNITGNSINGLIPREIIHIGGTDGGIYLLTPHTVFYRNNTHTEWQPFGSGLPVKLEGNYMRPFYKEGKIRMATNTRGLWSVDFYETPTAVFAQPTVNKSTSDCVRDTFQFEDYSMLNHTGATWAWTFSPAPQYVSSTSGRNPKVVFGASGNYTVTLTITDANGNTSSKTVANMVTLSAINACGLESGPSKSLFINGTSNYASTLSAVPLGSTNTMSISVWVKPQGIQVGYAGIVFSPNDNATGVNFRANNQLGYHWADGAGSYNWAGPTAPADVWSHIVLVVEPTKATMYLNGVPYTRTAAHGAVNFNSAFNFGNDRGNSARTMLGEIDEVRFYNRALTQNEVRELRHLSYIGGDANCVAYYKFNENNGIAYDRVGTAHTSFVGTATRVAGTVAVEAGQSVRQTVSTAGAKDFAPTGLVLTFPSAGPYPFGEICVSRLDGLPDSLPTNFEAIGGRYWVINNHGTATFNTLTEMKFTGLNVTSTIASRYKLYKRTSNEHLNNWTLVDAADAVTIGTNGSITFNTALNLTSFSQFVIVEKGVRISPKVFLQGAYIPSTGKMNDQLRASNLLPIAEPYTALNFGQIEGGGEKTTNAVFAITGNNAIVDWVFVELRDKNNAATKLFTRSALLQADGDVVDLDGVSPVHFANASAGDYYVVLRHRNHLGVMTANVKTLNENATSVDFSQSTFLTYGTNAQKTLTATVSGLWAGNTNSNDNVKYNGTANDRALILSKLGGITTDILDGYFSEDLNLDGTVKYNGSANDRAIILSNLGGIPTDILTQQLP
jgi:photosystem II stability/assembly factor-like uncharacterized protein